MKKNGKTIAALFGLALSAALPLAAHAQGQSVGAYAGLGGGQSEAWNYNCDPLPECKKKGTAWRFFGGWQFHRNFGVEIGYSDLGHVSSNNPGTFDQTVKVKLSEGNLIGFIHGSDRVSLFGKVGAYYARTTATTTLNGTTNVVKHTNGNPTIAGGIQFFVTRNIAVRGEGQRYLKIGGGTLGDSDYSAYTANVLWKFQ
jgi:OmpA-OmpF porin, OOP family